MTLRHGSPRNSPLAPISLGVKALLYNVLLLSLNLLSYSLAPMVPPPGVLASFLFLEYTSHGPAQAFVTGPVLVPLPGTLFSQTSSCLILVSLSFSLCSLRLTLTSPFKYAAHPSTPHSRVFPYPAFFFLKHCCLLSYHRIYSVMIFIIYCLSPKECNPQKDRFTLFCS